MALSDDVLKKIYQDIENKIGVSAGVAQSSTSGNSANTTTLSSSILNKINSNISLKRVGKTDTGVDEAFLNSFVKDSGAFFSNTKKEWDNFTFNSSKDDDAYSRRSDTAEDLSNRAKAIRTYLDINKDTIGEDAYKKWTDYLDQFDVNMSGVNHNFNVAKNYYSQWDDEDAYNAYVVQKAEYDAMVNFDLDSGDREIRRLNAILDEYRQLSRFIQDSRGEARLAAIRNKYGEEADIQALISQKKQYLNQARRIQEGVKFSGVADPDSQFYDPEFKTYSGYVSTKSDAPLGRLTSQYGLGYDDLTYEYINNPDGIRDVIDQKTRVYGSSKYKENVYEEKGYSYMTQAEVAIYNYYYAKDGKEKAEQYLDSIQETLNYRKANAMFANLEDNTALEIAFGFAAGTDQFEQGVKNLFNTDDDYIPASAIQMAAGMVREDLADDSIPVWYNFADKKWEDKVFGQSVGQMGYDAVSTSANMLPSIMASMAVGMINPIAGKITGSALMGASAAGNAYQEMLNLGYDKGQARTYSTLVGASEAGLQYLLGGVGKLGGTLSGNVIAKAMNGVDNAFLRFAIEFAGNMASEGLEEGLQEILTPWLQNLVMHTDENVNWSEVAYSTLLGALTAGVMEGPSTISAGVSTTRTGAQLRNAGISAERLADLGKTFAADTAAAQIAGRVNENTGAYTMGRLFNEIGATLTEQNMNDITNALIKEGIDRDIAEKNAEALAAVVEGANLTDRQVKIIEANETLAKAVRTTIIDPNATWFQRTKGYNEALMALAQEKSSGAKQASPEQGNASGSDNVDAKNKNGTEGRYGVDGIDTSPVKVKSISAIKNGKAIIKLDDGTEVDVREADVDPDDGVRIETIAGIAGISASDASYILGTLRATPGASAQMDSLGAVEAYKYGFYGFSQDHIAKHGVFANALSESQRKAIYATGQKARQQQMENATPKKSGGVSQQTGIYFDAGGGNVTAFNSVKKTLTEKQTAGVRAAQVLRKLGIGGDIYFFESYRNSKNQLVYKDKNGKEVAAPNGWYSEKDGSIHIDLNAGKGGNGFVLFTMAHELTHFIEQWSPQKYKVLADFLVENYEKGQSMDKLVRAKQEKLSKLRGKPVSYNEAYSEVIADSMEAMLADGNVLDKLIELKAKDNSLFMKMKQFFDNLVAKIRRIYEGQTPDSAEGQAVLEMKDSIEQIQQLFAEALVEASDNFRSAAESVVEPNSKPVAAEEILTDGAVVADGEGNKYSIRSMKHDIAEGQMFEDLKTYCNWTQKQVDELRKNLSDLVAYMTPFRDILDMNETYDREGRRFSPYKPNSDPLYTISMDFSTLCSKRLLTQYVIENLQLRENRPMSAEEQMAIRDMLNEYRKVEKGLQVACAMCYVEAARLKSPKQITKWMTDPETQMRNYFADKDPEFSAYIKEKQADFKESRGYPRNAKKKDMSAKDVRELNKIRPRLRTQYEVSDSEAKIIERAKALPNSTYLTAGNLAALSESDPTIYAAYTAFVRTATRSKSLETDEPYYYGDSTRDNGNGIVVSDSFIESVNRENGMRFSSWSDWRIQHLLDFIAAVIDNSVRGAAMHGYTKFGDEVRVLGKTGMMFNMSGVAGTQTGLNEDGSLSFSPTESIDANEAIQLREEFPETAGLQCIGVGDDHIVALLRSDIIDYVIPYHTSGLNAGLRRMVNIHGWKDYTTTQHAAIDKSIKFENAVDKEHWHEEPVYSEFFVGYDTGMTGIEAMRESADRYVQMCKDRGLKPKFEQFVKEDNYWKLLIDRKMVNQKTGDLIRQKPVTPTFDFDTIKAVVDKYVQNYDSGLEARALNHIVENWDSIPKRIRDLKKQGGTKAKKTSKAVDTLANQTLAAQPTEDSIKQSSREEAIELSDVNTRFSLREEAPPKRTIKAYKVFRVADGKLYPPKIANLTDDETLNVPLSRDPRKGKSRVTATGNDTPVGVWINADVGGIAVDENGDAILNTNGRIKVYDLNGMKGNGSFDQKTTLAFRPGWHLGSIPEAIQFLLGDGTMPDDLVYAECEIAADIDYQAAAMSYGVRPSGKFVHADAGLPAVPVDGYYKYKTNPKTDTHPWYISGAIKVNRIIGDAERRAICAKEGITIAPRYGGRDIEPTDIWESGQPAVAKDLTPYKKGQKNYDNENLLERTLEKIKGLSTTNPKLGYIQRDLDFNSRGIIDEIEKAKLDVDALRSAYEKHGFNPYYFDTDEEVKYSDRPYSYETLTSKPDMTVSTVDGIIPNNRADVVALAKKNAAKVGKVDPKTGSVSVYVDDINADVFLGTDGLKHGLRRTKNPQNDANYIVTVKAGEILKNSIKINEANPKKQSATGAYVMIGVARNTSGDMYIVRSIVNQFKSELASMDVLYAINAKKELAALNAPRSAAKPLSVTSSTISIAELLDLVNQHFPDILPEDVLKHYGYDARPDGDFGENVLYSDRDSVSVSNRSLLANALEGVAQNDIEKRRLQEYKEKIDLINAEEQQLNSLNEQIKELSFANGPKDTKKIRSLQFEAQITANRINTYDKQLLRLEASKPLQNVLEREKKMAYDKATQRGKAALEAYRERATKTQRELMDRYQESRKKGIENRQKTAMRHKIKNVVNDLNQYLLKGTKDRNVPIGLQKAVASALDAVNMDTVGAEERIAKLEAELLKAKTPEQIQEISRKIDHIREMGDKMSNRLKAMKDAYDEIKNDDDPLMSNAYDDGLSAHLMTLIVNVGDTALRDMNLEQLENVYEVYQIVLTTIRNANKAFKTAKSESISTMANRVMEEVEKVGGKKRYNLAAVEAIKKFSWNNLKPVYAFEHIGSNTFTEIFNNVRTGEDTWARDVTEARAFYLEMAKKHNFDSWKKDQWYDFQSTSGMDFSLNLEQIMSLYAYSKREQAADHLKRGGIVIDESTEITMKTKLGLKVKFNPTEATAYNISDETLAQIISKLTPEQKSFVDEMQDYLSTTMGAKGNEVSLQMYGIKLFKEKFYFPLKSATQFMAKAKEQQQGEVKIKNSGFSKGTVKKANNPIVLTPFMNVWASHVNEMSMYHAFVLPMEDFYRVYNYRTPTSDSMATESVEMFIQNAYGKGATRYIDQLLKDLNGGAITDSRTGFINKMMGMFKKGAVFASASVVVQQPSAIARAAALVDLKHFIGPKVDHKRHKLLWNEVKQYAPVAVIKEMCYFDTNMGKSTEDFLLGKEYSGIGEKAKALVTDSNYRDEILSKAPALADEIAWCSIWEAVKRETRAKNPGMDVKSDAFLKKAGERFTEVIVKTQVYDSVLSRSANMRSKDTGMKMATAFMAEPTTSINMIADALLKAKRGDKKTGRKVIGSVIAAQILNAFLVSWVYAARDDDEDETYWEKYLSSFVSSLVDGVNPATYIPFIKDIVSIIQGYDVERSDMAVIKDLWDAWQKLKQDDVSAWRKVEGFVGSICQIFGLPVKNIMRDVRGVWQTYDTIVNGEPTTSTGIKYAIAEGITGGTIPNTRQLYYARRDGDSDHAARVAARYDDEDSANAAVRSAIREMYLAGEIDLLTARNHLVAYAGMEVDEAHWTMDEWEYRKEHGTDADYNKYGDFYAAVESGDNLDAVVRTYTENGVKESTLAGQITEHFKPQYLAMSKSERAKFGAKLIDAFELCGSDPEDAEKKLWNWEFEAEHGFAWSDRKQAYLDGEVSASELRKILIDVGDYSPEDAAAQIEVYDWEAAGIEGATAAAVKNYNTYCKPAGVSRENYMKIRTFANNTDNDVDPDTGKSISYSAVRKIMAEINRLPVSASQKTALAYSCGWKDSTIKKYKLW